MRIALLACALIGCAYKPGSFASGQKAFPGQRITMGCLDVAVESEAKPILIWPADPKHVPAGAKRLGVHVARSIAEAVAVLESIDDLRKQSGVVRSLKKLFGRETPV